MSAADLEVTAADLRVTLAPLSAPHRTRTIAALCEDLNDHQRHSPGSRVRLRYAAATAERTPKRTVS
jgi:hypothetical protein